MEEHAVYNMKQKGIPIYKICAEFDISPSTVARTIKRVEKGDFKQYRTKPKTEEDYRG
jgi:IS30 family transposase